MKLKHGFILLFLLACTKEDPVATNGNLEGRVTDVTSGDPISGALVSFKGSSKLTGSDGSYAFSEIYSDSYTVSVTRDGYESDSRQVVISPEKTATADFRLARLLPKATPNSIVLDQDQLETTITLENKQSEKIDFTTQVSKSWIDISPNVGSIEPGNSMLISLSINPETLNFGTYNETLIINVASSSLTIPISFEYQEPATISITKPSTGETYTMGEVMPISWTSNLIGNVKIELTSNGTFVKTITSEKENNEGGNYSWEIPALSATVYEINITSLENPEVSSSSGTFTLIEGPTKPNVDTGAVLESSTSSITIKGNITSLGIDATEVSQHGHVYSKNNTLPTTADSKTSLGVSNALGEFTSVLSGLEAGQTYYIRSYATNTRGTSYGEVVTVTTPAEVPVVETKTATGIAPISVTLNGNVISNGGASLTERGMLWGETTPITLESNKAISTQVAVGNYSVNVSGLTPGTTYYFKAYAVNGSGVGYGDQLSFTTTIGSPIVQTLTSSEVSNNTATLKGRMDSDGGAAISSYGFVYATSQNPTLQNQTLELGSSLSNPGEFIGLLQGLSQNTTYYFRAYATNVQGTSYGANLSFTTTNVISVPSIITSSVTDITYNSAVSGGEITDDGGATVLERGVCWSTSPNPTTANSKTADGTGSGSFVSSLFNLNPETKYYLRAYARNSGGTAYGNEIEFTTSSEPIPNNLNAIQFVDNTVGYAVGDGIVIKTSNGGSNWVTVKQSSSIEFTSVYFINSSLGYIGANDQFYSYIYRTSNSGLTWEEIGKFWFSNEANKVTGVFASSSGGRIVALVNQFPNASQVYGHFYYSMDSGANWASISANRNAGFNSADLIAGKIIIGGNSVWTGSTYSTQVYESSFLINGTSSLTEYSVDSAVNINDLYMVSNYGYAVSDNGQWAVTTDNAQNWTVKTLQAYASSNFTAVAFVDELTGYFATNDGRVIKTVDGGFTWSLYHSTSDAITDLFIRADGATFITGTNGLIRRID